MKYCYECGTKLILKEHQDEGIIPYCTECCKYIFPIFSAAVSMVVQNPTKDKILLIQQYGKKNNVLVAGYINKAENAESAVVREVKEEIGIDVSEVKFNMSEYFEKTNTLMFNFSCVAQSEDLSMVSPKEIDSANWFSDNDAKQKIMENSLAKKFLLEYLKKKN